jgi:hypothetical protein
MTIPEQPITRDEDLAILRGLAAQLAENAASERNRACVARWYAHDEGAAGPPLLLTEFDAGLHLVMPEYRPMCLEPWAQKQETALRARLAHAHLIGDDFPLAPVVNVGWRIDQGDFGVPTHQTRPETDGTLGAYHIDPPLTDLPGDLGKLRPRTFTLDREGTLAEVARLREVYNGLLTARLRGNPWWTMGLTWTAITLIGLEELMMAMYAEPEALHALMAFLRDDRLAFLDWMEREELLNLNNENDGIGSGSFGHTRALPVGDGPVRARDLWTLIESQETVGVGPAQYAEFVFPYERAIAERFGRVYYGCCEPVHSRWEVLQHMPNLRRVSISPWCDQAAMAATLGGQYVFSRKPSPTLVSTAVFDEAAIRDDLRTTMRLTKAHGCPTEIVMKDVHTLSGEPDRLTRWVGIAREVTEEVYG